MADEKEVKRPWTPGPWEVISYGLFNSTNFPNRDTSEFTNLEAKANATLASKAPEMAELLIELVKEPDCIWEEGQMNFDKLVKKKIKAINLLKEVGYYDPKMD